MADLKVSAIRPTTISGSLQELVRSSRSLVETSIGVGEMQVAAAIHVGQRLRDGIVAPQVLERARKVPVFAQLRRDFHDMADLAADLGGVAFIVSFDAAEEIFRAVIRTAPAA